MLTAGEQRAIRHAIKTGVPFTPMTIRCGDSELVISPVKASPAWHPAVILARLEIQEPHKYFTQIFDKSIDLVLAIRDWERERKRQNELEGNARPGREDADQSA